MRTAKNLIVNIFIFVLGLPLSIIFAISYIMAGISLFFLASVKNMSFKIGLYILAWFVQNGKTSPILTINSTPTVQEVEIDKAIQ